MGQSIFLYVVAEICNAVATSRLVPGSTLPLPQGLAMITQLMLLSLYSQHLPPVKSYCLWKLNAGFIRTTIMPVVLYGCESWSLTLREECRLRVFEKRMLRRIRCMCDRASYMKMTRGTNLMQHL